MRKFRGALTPAVLVLVSLLVLGIGIWVYLGQQQGRRTPSPWPDGEPVAALSTEDPVVASVARTQQYVEAWRLTNPGDPFLTPLYRVDPGRHADAPQDAPTGLAAGLRTTLTENSPIWPDGVTGLFDRTSHPLQVIEWAGAEELGTFWQGYSANPVLAEDTLPGADEVFWYAGTNAQGCRVPDPIFLSAVARVGQTTVELSLGCLSRGDAESVQDRVRPVLEQTVAVAARVGASELPATYPSLAAEVPLIAGEDWAPEQILIAGRTDGVDATPLIAADLRDEALRGQLRGRNTVAVYADPAAVERVLTVDPTATQEVRTTELNGHRALCRSLSADADERCLIGVGRFIVVGTADAGDTADQVRALAGVS